MDRSEENAALARRALEALNRENLMVAGDPLATLREFCDPEVEWDFSRRAIDPEIYHGYDGWASIARQFASAWQELRLELVEAIPAGDEVVLIADMVGRSNSGIELSQRVAQVWTFRDGKLIRDRFFGEDFAGCLRAAGLGEDG